LAGYRFYVILKPTNFERRKCFGERKQIISDSYPHHCDSDRYIDRIIFTSLYAGGLCKILFFQSAKDNEAFIRKASKI
jgi:hypothetical protein